MRHREGASSWEIPGAGGEAVLGNAHLPPGGEEEARGAVLIVHGFLGYKDYGMFPHLAGSLAGAGFIAHRFNLSHSGMTNEVETFERPDLFEGDTWRNQVEDVNAVIQAVAAGDLPGRGLPYTLFGHSRGGATALLAAAERFESGLEPLPACVATAAAPSTACSLDEESRGRMLTEGFLEVRSNRTGQVLRLGREWLAGQLEDPDWHDLCARLASIRCPMLFIHGDADPTVPLQSMWNLERATGGRGEVRVIEGADHVFDTPNPMPPDARPSVQLRELTEALVGFVRAHAGG